MFAVEDGTALGRTPEAGICLDHPSVSRHHAVFGVQDGALTITDVGSTNGTMVNGQRLTAQGPVTLSPGDTIQVGGSAEMQLRVEEA